MPEFLSIYFQKLNVEPRPQVPEKINKILKNTKRHSTNLFSFTLCKVYEKNVTYVNHLASASCKLLRYFVINDKFFKMFSDANLIFSLKENIRLLYI